MATSTNLPRNLKIGSILTIVAGAFPFTVGTILFASVWVSYFNPNEPWLASQLPPGPASYSLQDIRGFSTELGTKFLIAQHVQFANLMNTGFGVMMLAFFGLRARLKWAWYVALVMVLWIGLNDFISALTSGMLPLPFIPLALGVIGLFIARPAIFGKV